MRRCDSGRGRRDRPIIERGAERSSAERVARGPDRGRLHDRGARAAASTPRAPRGARRPRDRSQRPGRHRRSSATRRPRAGRFRRSGTRAGRRPRGRVRSASAVLEDGAARPAGPRRRPVGAVCRPRHRPASHDHRCSAAALIEHRASRRCRARRRRSLRRSTSATLHGGVREARRNGRRHREQPPRRRPLGKRRFGGQGRRAVGWSTAAPSRRSAADAPFASSTVAMSTDGLGDVRTRRIDRCGGAQTGRAGAE